MSVDLTPPECPELIRAKEKFDEKWNKESKAIQPSNAKPDHFEKLHQLGSGSFGHVILVQHKMTHVYYAMKVLHKTRIVKLAQVEHTIMEKKALLCISCQFIVQLFYHFKDKANLYMVLEYVPGGELFTHMTRHGKFSEDICKFYASQIVLAFEYLHFMNLIYRDLKPENVLVDTNGYVKITDFGFIKRVELRTWTFCGTPEYLAPEIILNKGYARAVDFWTLGVFIYEMAAGYPPFHSDQPMKMYEDIVIAHYSKPQEFSQELVDLLDSLIQPDLTKRLGNLKDGCADVKNHAWFSSISWSEIELGEATPPFIPRITHFEDVTFFPEASDTDIKSSSVDLYAKEFVEF